MSEQNSLCFPCLEKGRTKFPVFPVFPVPWPPCGCNLVYSCGKTSGGSGRKRALGTRELLSVQFPSLSRSFRQNFYQIIGWCPHLWGSPPPTNLGNTRSATENAYILVVKISTYRSWMERPIYQRLVSGTHGSILCLRGLGTVHNVM